MKDEIQKSKAYFVPCGNKMVEAQIEKVVKRNGYLPKPVVQEGFEICSEVEKRTKDIGEKYTQKYNPQGLCPETYLATYEKGKLPWQKEE